MKSLVLFDIDNTLVHNSTLHAQAIGQSISSVTGKKADLDLIRKRVPLVFHGNTDRQIITDILLFLGADTDENMLSRCIEAVSSYYSENIGRETVTAVSGADRLLNSLSRSHLLGLITGNLECVAWLKLKCVSLDRYFITGGFGSDHHKRSRLIQLAMERFAALYSSDYSGRTVIIGDTPRDIDAANEAGVYSIAVTTGSFSEKDLVRHNPGLIVSGYRNRELIHSYIDMCTSSEKQEHAL